MSTTELPDNLKQMAACIVATTTNAILITATTTATYYNSYNFLLLRSVDAEHTKGNQHIDIKLKTGASYFSRPDVGPLLPAKLKHGKESMSRTELPYNLNQMTSCRITHLTHYTSRGIKAGIKRTRLNKLSCGRSEATTRDQLRLLFFSFPGVCSVSCCFGALTRPGRDHPYLSTNIDGVS